MAIQFDSPDEREVFHAKESWVPVALGVAPFLLAGLVAFAVCTSVFDATRTGLVLLVVCCAAGLISRIPRIVANLDTDVVITDKRLYARTGIINIKDQVCDLSNVSDVTVDPTVFGRVFDYADVRIQTFAGEQDFELAGIAHAYEMRRAISQASDAIRAKQGPHARRERGLRA